MLKLTNLVKAYGNHLAVDNISLTVKSGSIFGLLGPNGAGKSSLLRMVTGITQPDSGEIVLDNKIYSLAKHSQEIGYMPEERGLYKKMKVGEQAVYLAMLKGLSNADAKKCVKYWFDRLDMQSWVNKKVEDLSKGMSQKLQFVITVAHNPKLLILDEPFSGLDPVNSDVIKREIFLLAQQGKSIIFSTHRMEQVEEICEEIALMHKGKLILTGQVNNIKEQFKENLYSLKLKQSLEGFEEYIVSFHDHNYILKLPNEKEVSQLLQFCLQRQYNIKEFVEILPSINEIFINQIEGTEVRQFEN